MSLTEEQQEEQQEEVISSVEIRESQLKKQMGWLPDYPDIRDYSDESEEIKPMIDQAGLGEIPASLPRSVDLRSFCSPIENQGSLGSCTAQAGVGIMEYYERRAFGKHLDASKLFLYKATRNLLHWTGDTGAFLRTTMAAMAMFGVPPEEYWPYNIARYDVDPSAFCYSFAQNYQALRYLRLDPAGRSSSAVLSKVKNAIANKHPAMFGFTVYNSISQARRTGEIPFPVRGDRVSGGHAVVAVGYDDTMRIRNSRTGYTTTGAFIIRNSWGTGWGDSGYGYLPYQYVLSGLAKDWWLLLRQEWIDTKQFGL